LQQSATLNFGKTFPALPDPPHPVSAVLVAVKNLTSNDAKVGPKYEQAPASPASVKNSTPARSFASYLASAHARTGVDFLPSYRSLEDAKFGANDFK